jgi:ATP-dependent RNA helicase HelY
VVIEPARSFRGQTSLPTVLTQEKQVKVLTLADVPEPVAAQGSLTVPRHFNPKSPKARRDLATTLRIKAAGRAGADAPGSIPRDADDEDAQVSALRRALRAHPCHACPDREEHARWSDRWWRLRRESDGLQRKVAARTNTVATSFERICGLLTDIGYLADGAHKLTPDGERLRRLYSDRDLLTAECLRHGVWKRLDKAELAACVSMLVNEPRFGEADPQPRFPTEEVAEAANRMVRIWSDIEEREHAAGLPLTPVPDAGLAWAVHRWASGQRLEVVLKDLDLAAGDFVRRCKQVVDLLGQIADAAPEPHVRSVARGAMQSVLRGVVAADRLD